jgi:multidrug efflux pump subunit AcrA (membrane-fusion protein)
VIAAGQMAIRVAQLKEKEAVVAVPEALVDRLAKGKATVSLWSQPDRVYAAQLRELSPGADAATRTYQARFTIMETGDDVRFGMTATVTLSDPASGQVARLPLSAVVDKATGALEHKPIEVTGYEARDVLVRSGVNEGEWVVALGTQKLDIAQKVRVVDKLQF